NPVEQGFVDFEMNGFSSFYSVQEGGTFDFLVNGCDGTQAKLKMIDSKNEKGSIVKTIELSTEPIVVPTITVCNDLDDFMRIQLDGLNWEIFLNETTASINSENELYIYGSDDIMYYSAQLDWQEQVQGLGIYENVHLYVFEGDVIDGYLVTVEIIKFGENPGEVIIGTFSGDGSSGSFKAIRQ
ncbi:MAG: hypothetical protein AB8B69_17750, partial [Chitinophagales bacterium]